MERSEKSWDLPDLVYVHVHDFVELYLKNITQILAKNIVMDKKEIRRKLIICFSEWINQVCQTSTLVLYLKGAWKINQYPIFCPRLDQHFDIENSENFQHDVFEVEKRLARRFYIRFQIPYCQDFAYSMCYRMNRLPKFTFSDRQLASLKKLWTPRNDLNHCKLFKSRVEALAIRYRIVFDLDCILSVPKAIYENVLEMFSISKKSHTIIEGFASPFNTTRKRYCSPFTEDVQDWSSLGSFFDFASESPLALLLNPPHNTMESVVTKLTTLFSGNDVFVVLVTASPWKQEAIEKYKISECTIENKDATYWDFVKSSWVTRTNDQNTIISVFASRPLLVPIDNFYSDLVKIWKSIKN